MDNGQKWTSTHTLSPRHPDLLVAVYLDRNALPVLLRNDTYDLTSVTHEGASQSVVNNANRTRHHRRFG
jgi:hypothetical protein